MNILLTTIVALLVTLPTCGQPKQIGWRGVIPLRSTRADVIRLLGPPNVEGRYYEIDTYTVYIDYSDGPCEKGKSGWNVPRDTVVSISLAPNQNLKFSDLQINQRKYKKAKDGELPGIIYYSNEAEGITITVNDGDVRNIYYNPTSKDERLRCRNEAKRRARNADHSTATVKFTCDARHVAQNHSFRTKRAT